MLDIGGQPLLKFLFLKLETLVKKRPILDRCKKTSRSFWSNRFELVHCDWAMYLLTKPKMTFLTSHFD
jgi:hypothetical protein